MSEVMQFDEAAARRLEAVYLTPDVVAQRCAQLRILEPRPGERIVDVGCGTGCSWPTSPRSSAPAGRVLGLDVSPDVLALARRRCADWPWVACEQGDATALPAADGEFDAAVSVQVLEYVAEVDRALAEIHRVLRPGGRVLVVDSDWDAFVLNADDEARQARILAAWRAHAAHQSLPRSLAQRLRRSRLRARPARAAADVRHQPQPAQLCRPASSTSSARSSSSRARSAKARQRPGWRTCARVDRRGDLLFLLPRFVFLATKPR